MIILRGSRTINSTNSQFYQQEHEDCGGAFKSGSFGSLGRPLLPGNMALSTAVSILIITSSSNVSTAFATFWPVAALVSKYLRLEITTNVYLFMIITKILMQIWMSSIMIRQNIVTLAILLVFKRAAGNPCYIKVYGANFQIWQKWYWSHLPGCIRTWVFVIWTMSFQDFSCWLRQ